MHTASPSYPSSIIVLYDTTTTEIHTLSLHDALPISPATLSLLTTMFPEGRERTRALGLYTAVSVGGVSFGLVAGGILTELASWRWVMLVNVPIGILVASLAWLAVPHTPRRHGRFDLSGAITSTLGASGLVYGFV